MRNDIPPTNVSRLSFTSQLEFHTYMAQHGRMLANIWLWHETLGNQSEQIKFPGVCDICECQTTYTATPAKAPEGDRFEFRVPWWKETRCGCDLTNLDRAVLRVFLDAQDPKHHVYHVGHNSRLRQWLSQRVQNVTSSEYQEGRKSGEVEGDIRFEDLTRLSFDVGQFDCIICVEILEHIPDYQAALREMARTLAAGGRAILSFPWLGRDTYDHLIRAELKQDGSINHILPPEYHEDPVKPQGILSFRSFGWRILDDLRAADFSSASAEFVFGPLHGYMTLLNPVVVGIR
jgi:SAM-dependent methyltransferase